MPMPGGITLESVESLRAPFQKLITRAIASELHFHVLFKRIAGAREVDLDRVVDHEIDRHERLDNPGVLSQTCDCRTHRRQIDEERNARKVLEQHARDDERNLFDAFAVGLPVGELAHVVFRDLLAVTIAQHGFQDDANAVWQSRSRANAVLFELRE